METTCVEVRRLRSLGWGAPLLWALVLNAALHFAQCAPSGGADEAPARATGRAALTEQYAAHVVQLEKALDNVSCTCSCEERAEVRQAGKEPQKKPVVAYTAELFGKQEALEAVIKMHEAAASPGGREVVVCHSPRECFQLERPTPDASFQVKELASAGVETAPARKRTRMQANEYVAAYLAAATRAYEIPIKKLLERPPLSVERIEREGRGYVRAVFGFPAGAMYKSCAVLLDPEMEFAVKEYDYQFDSKPGVREWRRGAVDCKRLDNGFVVPAHVHLESGSDNGVSRFERSIDAALDHFTFGEVADSQFSLAAFGLPDLGASAASRYYPFDRWYFWCLLLAAVLGFWSLRRRTGTAANRAKN